MLVNRLEPLKGNRHGQHKACLGKQFINDQFRLCFVWTEAGPEEVEIVDYWRAAPTRSLCRFFGLSEIFWLRLMASHDLKLAKQALGGLLLSIEPFQPT